MDLEQNGNARAQLSPGAWVRVRPAGWTAPMFLAIVPMTSATALSLIWEMPR